MYLLLALAAAIGVGVVLYLGLAPGPRRWRVYARAQKLLREGAWKEVLPLIASLHPERLTGEWQGRLNLLAGEAHQLGLDAALKEKEFEEAVEHAKEAASRLGLEQEELIQRVVEAVLVEARRLFAAGPIEASALEKLLERAAKLAGEEPAEGTFWRALAELRQGEMERALDLLLGVHGRVGKEILDVPLYLGMLLHRLGRPQEALRYLADANRIDTGCPFVPWQMGVSIMVASGDSGLAMRALQRALSPRGLLQWEKRPDRLWIEAMPEGKSYIRRLATRHRYICPLLGGDLGIILRQGQLALAQALYRQERFQEAADLYGKLLGESPPTVMLLRGYGLALARLGQHDQAYKHLRVALEQEDPKDAFTAGYLALCGALGRPTNQEDKPRNVGWALKLLARYPLSGNAEWAGLLAAVHAEARRVGVTTSQEEQELLCDTLVSVQAQDSRAAEAYSWLATCYPQAVKPVYAWLYVRAAATNGVTGKNDLEMFARTFASSAEARAYFEKQGWDFAEIEYTYLSRAASQAPGRFPEVLGPDYPARGEEFLLRRSREQEQAGKKDPARECVEVLLRLAPASVAAHDRLACLHYRAGEVERSVELLNGWHKLAPQDHWPLVRQAILEQERGNANRRAEVIERALGLTQGALRAAIACLGAKLALKEAFAQSGSLEVPRQLLEECLKEQPDHAEALWCLAAVGMVQGDREGLARLAPRMDQPEVSDERFHYLGAVCQLMRGDYQRALTLAERAARAPALEVESRFVMGWARFRQGEEEEASKLFRKVAESKNSVCAPYAKALLGQLSHQRHSHEEAIQWWSELESEWRTRWKLEEPLRQTVLLSGLLALQEKRYEQAADRFREAGKLGLRERRLGSLITFALVKAGQRLLYDEVRKR